MAEITLENICFSYNGTTLLNNVNMHITNGEFVVILGPNGSGKSTLLKIMTGLLSPGRGTVTIDGLPVRDFCRKGRIGYVPQNYGRNTSFPATVEEIVKMGLVAQRASLTHTAARHIVTHMLTLVGMENMRHRRISDLSGGQQQRVMVARALAGNPSVLFLDEPTSGIDPEASGQIYDLLKHLNTVLGVTIVMVSHDVEKAVRMASRVACVNYGLCYFGDSNEYRKYHGQDPHFGRLALEV